MGVFKKKIVPDDEELSVNDIDGKDEKLAKSATNQKKVKKKPQNGDDDDSSTDSEFGNEGGNKIQKLDSKRTKQPEKKSQGRVSKKCTTFWRRFSCLVLSPVFLRHRNKIYILVEIFLPVLVTFAIFAAFTSGISWKKAYYEKIDSDTSMRPKFPEFGMEKAFSQFRQKYEDSSGRVLIFFTPVNNITISIMQFAMKKMKLNGQNEVDVTGQKSTGVVGVSSHLEMLEKALLHRKETKMHLSPIGVAFQYHQNSVDKSTNLPHDMSYSISTFDETISQTDDNYPYIKPARSKDFMSPYLESGFIGLQYAIEISYLRILMLRSAGANIVTSLDLSNLFGMEGTQSSQKLGSVDEAAAIKLRMFYYPNFYNRTVRYLISFIVCCTLVAAYLFTSYFIVRQLVQENQSGIKELLSMHGMPIYLHWVILFFHALIFRGITAALITWIFYSNYGHGQLLAESSPSLIFVILWDHLLALTFFNFFLATVIDSVTLVGLYSTLIGVLSFIVPVTFNRMNLIGDISNFVLAAAFPNWALYNILWNIIDFECDDKGITWSNFHTRDHVGNVLEVSTAMILLCCAGAVYFFLAAYRDVTSQGKLFPRTYHWWNICGKSIQRSVNRTHHKELLKNIKEGGGQEFDKPAIYEEEDPNKKCHVRIRHLCKRFGKHKMALDTINLNIMHKEITVFLGHGGCGKSTLISCLAGMVYPTSGYATIKNHDANFDKSKARRFTGLCTQKLIYFNLLTVKQHVFICYRLRGYGKEECNRHTATLLTRLRLWNVIKILKHISFGSKHVLYFLTNDELRRLGIAMALADSPKVLLLDEPTGGMDAFGRREIWTILKSLRQHHTIILTTNYMDEAEYLADRIALLAHGRLVCYGSVEYLKNKYDTGYFLNIEPMPNAGKLDSNAILSLIRSRLGHHAREKQNKAIQDVDNVVVELPRVQQPKFAELCDELDLQQFKLHFKKYSIRQVCLSDIFIKICESIASEKDAPDLFVRRDSVGDLKSALTSQIPTLPEGTQYKPKFYHQICALLTKRWSYMKTKNDFFIWSYIIPLFLIFLVVWEGKIFITPSDTPDAPRNLTFDNFMNIEVFYKMGVDDFNLNYTRHVHTILGGRGIPLRKSDRVLITLVDILGKKNNPEGYIKESHMTALELRNSLSGKDKSFEFVGYFASGALHSAPIILNALSNVLYRSVTGHDDQPYTLHVINEPFPLKTEPHFDNNCEIVCIIFAILLAFAYGIISASTISFPMRERANGLKHLQLMTGVHPGVYWLADFACDAVAMLIMTVCIGVIFFFDPFGTFTRMEVIVVLVIFTSLYFAWSGLAFSYFMSTLVPLKFNGFNFLLVFHIFVGIFPFVWLDYAWSSSESGIVVLFRLILLIFPGFAVTCAIHDWFEAISQRNICHTILPAIKEICGSTHEHQDNPGHQLTENDLYKYIMRTDFSFGQCCDRICKASDSCFKEPSILNFANESLAHPKLIIDIAALIFAGFFYWFLLLLSEKKIFARAAQHVVIKFLERRERNSPVPLQVPIDIRHESLLVKSMINEESFPPDTALVIQNLTKSHTATMIINNFNLEVKKGQCVGILGAGGSGKSMIMKMITGAMLPTKGTCYIGNSSLLRNRKQYLASIGYCPQENTLFNNFTGIQMLELMGRLRGIPGSLLSSHVAKWLLVMGLNEAGKDRCKTYGPGMQRRLCCAMALIGNSSIILLDEGTTGVDPLSRERFWAVLEHLKSTGHTIIFTTFHTEECMNLATKLVIVAEGNVQCLGTPEDLKRRYARGHCITFHLRHDVLTPIDIVSATMGRVVEFKKSVRETFDNCDLIDEQDNVLLYFLRDTTVPWGEVFRKSAGLSTEYEIIVERYDVTEAAIEDLFILLTNKYREINNPRRTELNNEFDISKEEIEIKALEQAAQALKMRV